MAHTMNGSRPVIVAGLRTPFAKQGTAYAHLSALDLGRLVVAELLERLDLDPAEVEEVVFGQVIPSVAAPNVAREIVLGAGMPRGIEAYTVSEACISSYRSAVAVHQAIADGAIACGIAGGAESASQVPVVVSDRLRQALLEASRTSDLPAMLKPFAQVRPADLVPKPPPIAEPSTGETMGEAAERMAKMNHISRADQDAFAHRSHTLTTRAWEEGRLDDEVMPVDLPPRYDDTLFRDNLVRPDSDLAKYADLPPVFDPAHGSVTAGNSSPLTDGASALLLMREDKARALGLPVLGAIRSYAFAGLDPSDQLLLGSAYTTPPALERAGIAFADLDLVDMHEAFAAEVLSAVQLMESDRFAREKLGREHAVAKLDWDRFNVNGGSIAVGHPFAATGARQITQTLRELQRRGGGLGMVTACAAGGLGASIVLEVSS